MARRRFQQPDPEIHGKWWTIRVRDDEFDNGERKRPRKRVRLVPADRPLREAKRVAAELLRPMNQGLESIGGAVKFSHFVEQAYVPVTLATMSKSTRDRYESVIRVHLGPVFGDLCLRDITRLMVDRYLAGLKGLSHESMDKIRDVLSSICKAAVRYDLLIVNPVEGVRLARARGATRSKPYITPEQFRLLIEIIQEPYATMVFVAVCTGLRFGELAALQWRNVHEDSITVDERYFRGDWDRPKSDASNATVAVNHVVITRIHALKEMEVEVKAGRATRRYKVIKADGPDDLVFQSPRTGGPMRDNNILTRHIKPAARALKLEWVNWQVLRRSFATWLRLAGADVKDAQKLMRHSRASTTLDIYQQFIPERERQVVERLGGLVQ